MAGRVDMDDELADAATNVSVGDGISKAQAFGINHPMYLKLSDQFAQALSDLSAREARNAANKPVVILTEGLDIPNQAAVEREYSEYTVKWLPLESPVHAAYCARRELVNFSARVFLAKYTNSVIQLGPGLLNAVFHDERNVHFELDAENPVAVHLNHSATVNTLRLTTDEAEVRKQLGGGFPPGARRELLTSGSWRRCSNSHSCGAKADGYAVDLTLYPMSVRQVLTGMLQCGAHAGVAILPYHPMMLLETEGEIPGIGIGFEFDQTNLIYKYPEGLAGFSKFDKFAWREWLVAGHHQFRTHKGVHAFRLEVNQVRGPFAFISIVEVPPEPKIPRVTRSLDTHLIGKGMVVVSVQRLKNLAANPMELGSWETKDMVVSASVVNKLYELAMSQTNGKFSQYTLVKRAAVVDARVVVEGSSVIVNPALTMEEMHQLVLAVHAKAFVDRYKMGRLTEQLMSQLNEVMGFGSLSRSARILSALHASYTGAWDCLIGGKLDAYRSALDRFRLWVTRVPEVNPVFNKADEFITLESIGESKLAQWRRQACDWFFRTPVLVNHRGYFVDPAVLREDAVYYTGRVTADVEDTRSRVPLTDVQNQAVEAVTEINDFKGETLGRHVMPVLNHVPTEDPEQIKFDYNVDPDFVGTMNAFHETAFPGLALQDFGGDSASLSLDPQDRTLAAQYLRLRPGPDALPAERKVFKSRIKAYRVEKRPQTTPELLSSATARNLNAPKLSLPQPGEVMYDEIWENFLDQACRPDARELLAKYQSDPMELGVEAFAEWTRKAKPGALQSLIGELAKLGKSFEEYDVGEYIAMLKSDVKPPVSDKPNYSRVEPQVIVYHPKPLSALYSSIFRVIAKRFTSLLDDRFMLNLDKDKKGVRDFIQTKHPWGSRLLHFLENDFSKYDKSQGEFVFGLEAYIFERLGLNKELLNRWLEGHAECRIRAASLGLVLYLDYQRKSGDATTALGNGILNIVSVVYAYKGTRFIWGVFQGDDSLVCTDSSVVNPEAPRILGEVFNLQAKFYQTGSPYFASMFVGLNDDLRRVSLIPDPLRLAEKWAMSINADKPMWSERWKSAVDVCSVFKSKINLVGVADMIRDRYAMDAHADVSAVFDAIATAIQDEQTFRSRHEDNYTLITA